MIHTASSDPPPTSLLMLIRYQSSLSSMQVHALQQVIRVAVKMGNALAAQPPAPAMPRAQKSEIAATI